MSVPKVSIWKSNWILIQFVVVGLPKSLPNFNFPFSTFNVGEMILFFDVSEDPVLYHLITPLH